MKFKYRYENGKRVANDPLLCIAQKVSKDVYTNELNRQDNLPIFRQNDTKIGIKTIFEFYWEKFKLIHSKVIRPEIVENVEKFLDCGNISKGHLYYECPDCNNFHIVPFTCKSRFCPSCGKKYRDQLAINMSAKLIDAPHRHMVFSLPLSYRNFFLYDYSMLNVIFESLDATMQRRAKEDKIGRRENRNFGYISTLHTYGRVLKWHPHLHLLICERISNNLGILKRNDFFPFKQLKLTFLYTLTDKMARHMNENKHKFNSEMICQH